MRSADRLTPELLDAVLADVHRGVPAYRAARSHGIAKSTFYDWLRWGEEGRAPYATLVARLAEAAESTPNEVAVAPARGSFVGRDRELETLRAAVETACGGRGQLLLIVGEAGIGKTRLTEELALQAGTRMRPLVGRCFEGEGAPPFWPWVQIVRGYARTRDPRALLEEMGAWAADIAQVVPELHDHLAGLPPTQALDPAHARFRVFDGMTNFLAAAARHQPLLLVLDDLHWADRPSLLLLEFLARTLQEMPLLVVGTYRDAEVRPAHPLLPALAELAREPVCERIVLQGLAPADVVRFIQLNIGQSPSDALATAVYEKSEGNPFFITELVRLIVENDATPSSDGAPRFAIPEGVRAVIARRLNRLSEECNRILVLAAAFGREFALEPLMRVSDAPIEQTLEALDEAVRAGVVTEVAGGVSRYLFSHALVRESLYEELGAIRRPRLHRRIAEALVEVYGPSLQAHFDELAHHFFQAALGGAGVEEAIDYAVRAAEQALNRLAYEQASEHYELALRGLELAKADDARRGRLLLALGDAFARASDVDRAKDVFLQAAAIARKLGDAGSFAAAALGFGGVVVGVGTVDGTLVDLLEESLDRLDRGDSHLRAMLLARLAAELYFAPDVERRFQLSEQAIAMARRIDHPAALVNALEAHHFAVWGHADPGHRLALATEIVHLAERLDDRELLLRGHHFRISDLLELGDIAAVDGSIATYERLAAELRQPAYSWRLNVFRAMRELMNGRFEEAEARAVAALALGQRVQSQTAINFYGVQLFSLRREQGRLAELESSVRTFVDSYPAVPSWRSALASLYAELGRIGEARAEFERLAEHDFSDLPRDNSRLMGLALLAETCAAVGDRDRAALLYDLLVPSAGCNVVAGTAAACNGSVARPLALLAATLGRWELAASHFEEALRMNRALGAAPFIARTQLEYGAMLLSRPTSTRAGARRHLEAARQSAAVLGMKQVEGDAERLLDGGVRHEPRIESRDVAAPSTFRLDGEVWTLVFDGVTCRVKDARGMRYIAALLRHPNVERHALELVREVAGTNDPRTTAADAELGAGRAADATGSPLDAASRRAYRERLKHLRVELAQAERTTRARHGGHNAPERVAELKREMEFLDRQLAAGTGLGGRLRAGSSSSERARVSVTRSIKLAIESIGARHATLAAHLKACVRTGTYCSYMPSHDQPIDWRV